MVENMNTALVLAAGRGSRMKNLTDTLPKHMLPVAGKPLLERLITGLRNAGLTRLIIITGYLHEVIEDYFKDGSDLGVNITYIHQPVLNGTGSAVRLAEAAISTEPFLLTFGDILAGSETYLSLVRDYEDNPCDVLMALNWVDDPYTGAAVYLDDTDRVVKVVEKPEIGQSDTNWNQSGIFIFSPIIFDYTSRLNLSQRREYELTEAVNLMLKDGRSIRGHRMFGAWCDVGRPEDIRKARELLEDEK